MATNTENQHRKIAGYRELTQEEIDLMNRIKGAAEVIGNLVVSVENAPEIDHRWAAIARTDLQKGFMALTRAVTKPTSF